MVFIQENDLLIPIPKKNVFFNIHHLLFQNQYFFWSFFHLMNTIKTIIVLIELQLNPTVNSLQTCLDHAEKQKIDIDST